MDPETLKALQAAFEPIIRKQNRALLAAHALSGLIANSYTMKYQDMAAAAVLAADLTLMELDKRAEPQ